MTHLHVKSTEPKAAPQPVSTELHHREEPDSISCLLPHPKHRKDAGHSIQHCGMVKAKLRRLYLVNFYEEGTVLGI